MAAVCYYDRIVGLRINGTVIMTTEHCENTLRDVGRWKGIVAAVGGFGYMVGLCADGTVVTAGCPTELWSIGNSKIKFDTSEWKLFDSIDTLGEELEKTRRAAEAERVSRRAELEQERDTLKTELASLKGIFAGIRRRDIETRLEQIETGLESYKED